ncbi:MAG: hypothetical protein ACRYFV_15900 [Janthinobacterium lividum]
MRDSPVGSFPAFAEVWQAATKANPETYLPYAEADLKHYHDALLGCSNAEGKTKFDWLSTILGSMRRGNDSARPVNLPLLLPNLMQPIQRFLSPKLPATTSPKSPAMASSEIPPRPVLPPSWQDVVLSPEQQAAALCAAQQAEWQRIKSSQYAWDVSYPAAKAYITFEQLLATKLREAQAQGLHYEGEALQVFRDLAWYFSDDGAMPLPNGPDPDKGLLLVGPVGCGKTTLLRLFMRNPVQKFGVVSTRTVASAYQNKTKDTPGLEPYFTAHHSGGVMFDDLGTEPTNVQNFGTTCNPMAEVLLARYDEFQAGCRASTLT